jgi:hypothetical protein
VAGLRSRRGLAGDFVRTVDPETESDPVALLGQFLAAFGSVVGRGAWQAVGTRRHYGNLFVALVGPTGKARKGTALSWVEAVASQAAPDWAAECVLGGLSSGEGLINAVRDGEGDASRDKRLLAVEEELAAVFRAAVRDGNTLSAILRKAWDGGPLRTMTRANPLRATGAHVSLIGHITRQELSTTLGTGESWNGLANRFIWLASRRSKLLPEGGGVLDLRPLVGRLESAIAFAAHIARVRRTADCVELWRSVYARLSADRPGALGAVTARAEAQVLRLSGLYALLDESPWIDVCHLQAALALWDYSERSCRWVFGDRQGDPDADLLLAALRDASARGGLSLTEISAVFGRHKPAPQIHRMLRELAESGVILLPKPAGGGKPAGKCRLNLEIANPANPAKAVGTQEFVKNDDSTQAVGDQQLSQDSQDSQIGHPFNGQPDAPAGDREPGQEG